MILEHAFTSCVCCPSIQDLNTVQQALHVSNNTVHCTWLPVARHGLHVTCMVLVPFTQERVHVCVSLCNKPKAQDSRFLFHLFYYINCTCVREPWIMHMSHFYTLVSWYVHVCNIFFNKKRTSVTEKETSTILTCIFNTRKLNTRFMVPLRENGYNVSII